MSVVTLQSSGSFRVSEVGTFDTDIRVLDNFQRRMLEHTQNVAAIIGGWAFFKDLAFDGSNQWRLVHRLGVTPFGWLVVSPSAAGTVFEVSRDEGAVVLGCATALTTNAIVMLGP